VEQAYSISMEDADQKLCRDYDALRSSHLCFLPADVQKVLDSFKSFKLYPPNAVLFRQNHPADRIFILRQGRVRLTMHSDRGKPLPLHIAIPGEVLGLSACIAGGCYEATAEALEFVDLAVVPRGGFLEFLRTEQLACLSVLTLLCDHLHIAHEQLRWVASSNVIGKNLYAISRKDS
jgi:CRP/FNR family transcriptional regulator, cyclic AMP receptor protein